MDQPTIPIGRSGALEAVSLTGPDGDHAVLIRQSEQPRALLTGESQIRSARGGPPAEPERLVVTPLDHDVDVRIDGDALAVWLASAPIVPTARSEPVPPWASLIGLVVLLVMLAFAVFGSLTFFGWLAETIRG
jgi:hypothetical protein